MKSSRLTRAGVSAVILTFWLIGTFGCGKGAPTKDELDHLIDQRLADRGIKALPTSTASAPATSAPKVVEPSKDPSAASNEFLDRLDELMKDFKPTLPVIEDKSDLLRCVTSDTAKSNVDIGKVVATMKSRTDAAKEERKRRAKEFYDSTYPLAFHLDYDWASRKTKLVPAQYGCFNASSGKWTSSSFTRERCENNVYTGIYQFDWRVRVPERPAVFLYSNTEAEPTQPPELMRKIEGAGMKVPQRFSCRVDDVLSEQDHHTIKCSSSGTAIRIQLVGSLPPLNIGDVVSVPLADTKGEPDGVLFKHLSTKTWVVTAEASALKVDMPASCPALADVLSAADAGPK